MNKRYEIIDKVIEWEIYLYIVFMFITKGEGIRNVLLFSAALLWLSTVKFRQNRWILKEPVPLLFWGFIATILLSVIFSIDPLYSLKSLREEPLRSVLIFMLISTTLSDEQRLKRFLYVSLLIFAIIVSTGFYSFIIMNRATMYTDTFIRHANPNRTAVDLGVLLSFLLVLFLTTGKSALRNLLLLSIITGVLALILTGSRGGNIAFMSMISIWAVYLFKKKLVSPEKFILWGALTVTLFLMVTFFIFPSVSSKFMKLPAHTANFHRRTEIWKPLLYAAKERPVFGWGYGSDIFTMDTPFLNTPYKAPVTIHPGNRNPHNAFFRVLFHQGLVGLISYIALLLAVAGTTWRDAFNSDGFRSYILIAVAGILISFFFINSIVENSRLTYLSFILGLCLSARYMKEADP
jgi:O-antigen ligase